MARMRRSTPGDAPNIIFGETPGHDVLSKPLRPCQKIGIHFKMLQQSFQIRGATGVVI
ncbi:hypothetical protein GGI1_06527 [Acidithiobacillus sp. GGI-221]|nr:hypothetical protein GGI1_06527 [Acidithiobacillus sp. GGI-221]